ncbi:MAG: hypothetical protein U0W40_05530 [Acidimicrobiia bacterium]
MSADLDRPSIRIADDGAVTALLAGYRAGDRPLTGLELYYELERTTPLLEFHTMIRLGPRNREHNGLQQSYGDHNRLLMLGLDKLVEGDVDWYRSRLEVAADVDDDELRACFAAVASLQLPRDVMVALWLAAAMHDCGMLCGRVSSVDVEDGVVLGRDVIDALCPEHLRDLAYVVLRHHDYIKDCFLGEVPVGLIGDDVDRLDPSLRPVALAALGAVQVAGAASLGEGRLGEFRMEIFRRCADGTALLDRSPVTRLARLLSKEPQVAGPAPGPAEGALATLATGEHDTVEALLERVPLHRWHRTVGGLSTEARMGVLVAVADAAAASGADHVVLGGAPGTGDSAWAAPGEMVTSLSGRRLLLLDPGAATPAAG